MLCKRYLPQLAAAAAAAMTFAAASLGADWPTYLHDKARSGVTSERVALPLSRQWVFDAPHPPAPGWGKAEAGRIWKVNVPFLQATRYDDAYHVAVEGDRVYFCTSAANKVYCIDAAAGKIRWVAYTGAPSRLAPTVNKGKVYVGADDGIVYCLDAADGRAIWKFTAAPKPERLVGQGRIMSHWPVRTGVVVDNGVAYFGAGLYPNEELYLYAVDASTGRRIWQNDSYAARANRNISPQGYLVVSADKLIMPTSRTLPIAFERASGRFLFRITQGRSGPNGGSYAMLAGDMLFNGTSAMTAYDLSQTKRNKYGQIYHGPVAFSWINARRAVVKDGTVYMVTDTDVFAIARSEAAAAAGARTGFETNRDPDYGKCTWRLKSENVPDALILAGDTLFAGGDGKVVAIEAATGARLWTAALDGHARGLAVANGRLLVSTTTGKVYSFGPGGREAIIAPSADPTPYPADGLTGFYAATARTIVRESGITKGFCLILGGERGRLAYELARQTELNIYVVEPDAKKVAEAKKAIDAAGLYGVRVTVERGSLASLSYPPYFANLVVSEEGFFGGTISTPAGEFSRVLRPCGGVAFVGQPAEGSKHGAAVSPAAIRNWSRTLAGSTTMSLNGPWATIERGKLPDAGDWTHQHANAANTASSEDERVRPPFGLLWFGDPGPHDMIDRHGRPPAPLVTNGRAFMQGRNDLIIACDAYNGHLLWRRTLAGAHRQRMPHDSSGVCTDGDSLFVAGLDKCYRLNAATGETVHTYALPARSDRMPRRWGWIATRGKLLFGSRTETNRPFKGWPAPSGNTSEAVFALDIATGARKWTYAGKGISHNAIAVGDGMVFLLDKNVPEARRPRTSAARRARVDRRGKPIEPDIRMLVALDAATGKKRWDQVRDLDDCTVDPSGGDVTVMYKSKIVLVCGSPYHQDHQLGPYHNGTFRRRSISAFAAADGKEIWSGGRNYQTRPIVAGKTIYAEPWFFGLATGKHIAEPRAGQPWQMFRGYSGGCGGTAASANLLFFRGSGRGWNGAGYYNMATKSGMTALVSGQRPSCWISCVPANGLVVLQEGSAGCTCLYTIQCSAALYPLNAADPPRP